MSFCIPPIASLFVQIRSKVRFYIATDECVPSSLIFKINLKIYFLIDIYVRLEKSIHVLCPVNYPKDEYPAVPPARSGK